MLVYQRVYIRLWFQSFFHTFSPQNVGRWFPIWLVLDQPNKANNQQEIGVWYNKGLNCRKRGGEHNTPPCNNPGAYSCWSGGRIFWSLDIATDTAANLPLAWNLPTKLFTGWWFHFFYFHPKNWGYDPIWRAYFWNGLKPPTSLLSNLVAAVLAHFLVLDPNLHSLRLT